MSKLNEVRVSYRRLIQPVKYESAEASVELSMSFPEGESPDVDDVIASELRRAQAHVEVALGIDESETPVTERKIVVETKPAPVQTDKKAPPKPKASPKPKPAPKKEAGPVEEDAPQYTKGDMMKAISRTMEALQKKGVLDGSERVNKLIRAYLPDDRPPQSYARIPQHAWGDFIKDVEDLKDA